MINVEKLANDGMIDNVKLGDVKDSNESRT
jgi:hypothetical protein